LSPQRDQPDPESRGRSLDRRSSNQNQQRNQDGN
jgi:hypothetical protein